jgi:hypothetical protein
MFSFDRAVGALAPLTSSPHPVLEIPMPNLGDAAMASLDPMGRPIILYDPALCRAAGAASEFFRAHEYAHVRLGHLYCAKAMMTAEGRATAEAEADCFAAKNVSRLAMRTMVALVLRQAPGPRDAIYGSQQQRARRILSCAHRDGACCVGGSRRELGAACGQLVRGSRLAA